MPGDDSGDVVLATASIWLASDPKTTNLGSSIGVDASHPGETIFTVSSTTEIVAADLYAISGSMSVQGPDGPQTQIFTWNPVYVITAGGVSAPAILSDVSPQAPPSNHAVIPCMQPYWMNGFDLPSTSFATAAVFAPTYNNASHVTAYGPNFMPMTYAYPDHIDFTSKPEGVDDQSRSLIKTESDYKWTFTLQLKNSAKMPGVASVDQDTTFTYKGEILSNDESAYNCDYYVEVLSTSKVDASVAPPLNPTFSLALRTALDTVKSKSLPPDDKTWTDFFSTFGSHYLQSGSFGGFMVFTSEIDKSLVTISNEASIQHDMKAAYTDVMSGTVSANEFMQVITKNSKSVENVHTTLNVRGGTIQTTKEAYASSVYSNPILLMGLGYTPDDQTGIVVEPPTFSTFADFLSDPDEQGLVNAATDAYCGGAVSSPTGLLATVEDASLSVATHVKDDLFVLATNDSNNMLGILADAGASPTTTLATLCGSSSLLVPIPSQDTYVCSPHQTSDAATPASAVSTVTPPLLSNGAGPTLFSGAWTALTADRAGSLTATTLSDGPIGTFTPPGPGFLLVCLQSDLVTLTSDHKHPQPVSVWLESGGTVYAGGGVTYVVNGPKGDTTSTVTFGVPVTGAPYQVSAQTWQREAHLTSASVWWLPIDPTISLGEPQLRSWNIAYQADTDGFCVATAACPALPKNPMIPPYEVPVSAKVRTAQTAAELTTPPAAVLGPADASLWYGVQSLVLPVVQSAWYQAESTGTLATDKSTVWFVPFTRVPVTAPSSKG